MRSRRAIVFDLDDTLYPTRRFVISGFRAVATHLGDKCGGDVGAVFRSLCAALRAGNAEAALQRGCDRAGVAHTWVPALLQVFREHEPSLRLPTSSTQVIEACRRSATVGVLTNGDPAMQQRKVAALGLDSRVDAIVYAHAHDPLGKPAPAAFAAMAAALGSPREVTMIGDNFECDVLGALRMGWRAVWLERRSPPSRHDVPANVIRIQRLRDLLPLAENS